MRGALQSAEGNRMARLPRTEPADFASVFGRLSLAGAAVRYPGRFRPPFGGVKVIQIVTGRRRCLAIAAGVRFRCPQADRHGSGYRKFFRKKPMSESWPFFGPLPATRSFSREAERPEFRLKKQKTLRCAQS